MNDDWRLRIDLREHGIAHQMGEILAAEELEHDLERAYHDRVVVSVDDNEVFCYAGSRAQAEAAARLIRRVAGEHGWELRVELRRWHAAAELWEDPDAPTEDPAEAREERVEEERIESREQGYPEFEVRVELGSRGEAGELAGRLRDEGMPVLHRFSYILVGATDEDSARALAGRLREAAPNARSVTVERNRRAIYEGLPRSPFSVLGGMGG